MAVINIDSSCDSILQKIRKSGLNFSCQETPFSIYVTVRKSWTKQFRSRTQDPQHHVGQVQPDHELQEASPSKYEDLLSKYERLLVEKNNVEEAFIHSEQNLENTIEESERRERVIEELSDTNSSQCDQIQTLMLKVINGERKYDFLEETKEQLSKEAKKLKQEIGDLKNAVSLANTDVKILKKEKVQLEHEFQKKSEAYDFKISNLKQINADKMADDKAIKTKEKKLNKKIRALEEAKSEFTIEKRKFEKECNNNHALEASKPSSTSSGDLDAISMNSVSTHSSSLSPCPVSSTVCSTQEMFKNVFQCDTCDQIFASLEEVKEHRESVHK